MNGITEHPPRHPSGRTQWHDREGRLVYVFDPREHTTLRIEPKSGKTIGSYFDAWNLDEARERVRLIEVGTPDHTHRWVPRPTVGGVMTCECGCRYRFGKIEVP